MLPLIHVSETGEAGDTDGANDASVTVAVAACISAATPLHVDIFARQAALGGTGGGRCSASEVVFLAQGLDVSLEPADHLKSLQNRNDRR